MDTAGCIRPHHPLGGKGYGYYGGRYRGHPGQGYGGGMRMGHSAYGVTGGGARAGPPSDQLRRQTPTLLAPRPVRRWTRR